MGKIIREHIWQSIHSDYLRFAVLSVRDCEQNSADLPVYGCVNRHVIEAIRYSYDCLEASVEFVFHMGCLNQLPITLNDNWLSRHVRRKWNSISLSERLPMLTFAWTGKSFWENQHQYQLFEDLKKVRDGLTHPIPFGTEIEKEIITQEKTLNGIYTESRRIGERKELRSDWLVHGKRSIARFELSPDKLKKKDAELALEILLRHLIRLEDIFFGRRTTWFCYYDDSLSRIISTEELFRNIDCRFENVWYG